MNKRWIDGRDVLGLAGFVALEVGLSLWWPPAAWIVAGVILLAVAVMPEIRRPGRADLARWFKLQRGA